MGNTSGRIIAYLVFGLIFSLLSAKSAKKAAEEEGGRELADVAKIIFVTVNTGIAIILAAFTGPWPYIVIFAILGYLQLNNQEGRLRASSWNRLAVLHAILLALSIAKSWDVHKVRPWYVVFMAMPIVVMILGKVQVHRLNVTLDSSDDDPEEDDAEEASDNASADGDAKESTAKTESAADTACAEEEEETEEKLPSFAGWAIVCATALVAIAAGIGVACL